MRVRTPLGKQQSRKRRKNRDRGGMRIPGGRCIAALCSTLTINPSGLCAKHRTDIETKGNA